MVNELARQADHEISLLTETEARAMMDAVRHKLDQARAIVSEFYQKRGWIALGYGSFKECLKTELDYSLTHGYRLINAAKIDDNLGRHVPERQARVLMGLTNDQQHRAYARAESLAFSEGLEAPMTRHVEVAVAAVRAEDIVMETHYHIIRWMVDRGELSVASATQIIAHLDAIPEPVRVEVLGLIASPGVTCPALVPALAEMINRPPGHESIVLQEIIRTGHLAGAPLRDATLSDLSRARDEAQLEHISDSQRDVKALIVTVYPDDARRTFNALLRELPHDTLVVVAAFIRQKADADAAGVGQI